MCINYCFITLLENEFPYFSGEEVTLHISENFNTSMKSNTSIYSACTTDGIYSFVVI